MALKNALFLCLGLLGCASPRTPSAAEPVHNRLLAGSDGRTHPLLDAAARFTVIEFFSAHCKCQAAHDPRWRELTQRYAARGVAFVALDSEQGADAARDRQEAARRGYAEPILLDTGGALARELGARYATYTVLVDREGRRLYAGGLDSDLTRLSSDARFYLSDALEDALAGRSARRPSAETLGCALMLE